MFLDFSGNHHEEVESQLFQPFRRGPGPLAPSKNGPWRTQDANPLAQRDAVGPKLGPLALLSPPCPSMATGVSPETAPMSRNFQFSVVCPFWDQSCAHFCRRCQFGPLKHENIGPNRGPRSQMVCTGAKNNVAHCVRIQHAIHFSWWAFCPTRPIGPGDFHSLWVWLFWASAKPETFNVHRHPTKPGNQIAAAGG